jgi:hypothetical protein
MPGETIARVKEFAAKGGIVVATRREHSEAGARFVADEVKLGETLRQLLPPDLTVSAEAAPVIGFAHRETAEGSIYFVANTSNRAVATAAKFRAKGKTAESWNPFSGEQTAGQGLELKLAPYESRVIVFSDRPSGAARIERPRRQLMDLSKDWRVTFDGASTTTEMKKLHSWTDDPATRFYSGRAVYRRTFDWAGGEDEAWLNFGEGQTVEAPPGQAPGMRAMLESPVRESARVFVNGELAGTIWHPPYELAVTRWLKHGTNELLIEVANLAINEMAGKALPTYRLLNLRYGERFTPQGFENLQALPAGLLGPIHLEAAAK